MSILHLQQYQNLHDTKNCLKDAIFFTNRNITPKIFQNMLPSLQWLVILWQNLTQPMIPPISLSQF